MRNGSKLISDLGLYFDAWAHHLELTSTAVGWQEDILIGVSDKHDNRGYCDFHNQHLCSVYFTTFVNYCGVGGPVLSVCALNGGYYSGLFHCRRISATAQKQSTAHLRHVPLLLRKPVTIPALWENWYKALLIAILYNASCKNTGLDIRMIKKIYKTHLRVKTWPSPSLYDILEPRYDSSPSFNANAKSMGSKWMAVWGQIFHFEIT